VALNAECEKDHPSPLVGANKGFMCNLATVTLHLAKPILTDAKIAQKIDWEFLNSEEFVSIFPSDTTPLYNPSTVSNSPAVKKEFNFIMHMIIGL
jgi:hypothetical protein